MKKIILAMSLALLCTVSLFAQGGALDQTFRIVKADGTEVPDGSVLYLTDLKESLFGGMDINSGLYVKNTSSSGEAIRVTLNISSLTAQSGIQFCVGMSCNTYKEPGSYQKTGFFTAGSTNDLQLEWMPAEEEDEEMGETKYFDGSGTATLAIEHLDDDGKLIGTGPSITLNFIYDSTNGINNVEAQNGRKVVARYNANGQLLTAPQKGLNIVKYADGTSAKMLVK